MNFSNNINNIIIGSIILIISAFFGYRFLSNPHLEDIDNSKPKIIIKEDNIINEYLEKEFSKVLGIFSNEVKKSAQSMVKFNDNFLLKNDYLNFRNSLYTKDIEKQYILVDTKNSSNDIVKHNYRVDFTASTNNRSGGYGVFKNVIGFRLIKATVQNLHYTIHEGNNKLYFYHDTAVNPTTLYVAEIKKQRYINGIAIASALQTALNSAKRVDNSATISNPNFKVFYSRNLYKYIIYVGIFEPNITTDNIDEFIRDPTTNFSHTADNKYFKLSFQKTKDNGFSNDRLFGFDLIDSYSSQFYAISNNVTDVSIHYIDIDINEIPYIACKKNPLGKNIVDRIPLDVGEGGLVHYRAPTCEYFSQNYFYPISLNGLTIKLFEDSEGIPYYNENADHYFEFEITMLKNTKLSN